MEMARRLGVDVSTIRQLERRAIGLLSATKVNLISPCLFMATRWRQRTTLSRRQDRLSIANLGMWRFQFHILLWSLIVPHLFFINKVFLQTCLPFNLDRMINIKPNFITVHSFDQMTKMCKIHFHFLVLLFSRETKHEQFIHFHFLGWDLEMRTMRVTYCGMGML